MSLKIETKTKGAEITSIKLNEKEKLHQAENVLNESGEPYWNRHSPILFPMVGKLRQNKTIIENNTYEMGQHGFARDMEFELIEKNNKIHKYILKSNKNTLEKYPYLFELLVTYKVNDNKNELEVIYEVINKDERNMCFGIGGHPAFICDYSSGDYELEFENEETNINFIKLKDGLVSNETFENVITNNKYIKLNKDTFSEDAVIMENIKSNIITLKNNLTNEKILDFNFTGFPYLAIWSKKGAPFVCIEPWFTTADNIDGNGIFKDKKNSIKLESEEKFMCSYKIKFY